ncbi:MAG: MOSC domain-containing protein, partial [bacterium]|nr:MOSC domain-containing protein [bacterium]
MHRDTRRPAGMILAVCVSRRRGSAKHAVRAARCRRDHGIIGDAHAGGGPRQVSVLDVADIGLMRKVGVRPAPGAFGENIVVKGVPVGALRVGDLLGIVGGPLLQVTQVGKTCHNTGCAIRRRAGFCIMPSRCLLYTS